MKFWKDTAERVATSFLFGWLSAWLAIQDAEAGQLFAVETLTTGLVAAAMSLLKALGARTVGNPDSASLVE